MTQTGVVMPTPFTIAILQSSCTTDPQANLEKTIAQIRQAAAQGANVICTQELFRTQYFCQSEDPANFAFAEPIPGPTTEFGRIGVLICWDQWYPEAARLTALQDCSVLFYPTAIGWHPRATAAVNAAQRDAWITIQRSHAIANGLYVASPNRQGLEKLPAQSSALSPQSSQGLDFWGSSFIADPFG